MTNLYVQPSVIASEALMHLEDALVIGNLAYRDKSTEFNKDGGYAVGDNVTIKTRPEYKAEEFTTAIVVQDIREAKHTLTIEKHFDISVEVTAKQRALDLDSYSEQVIKPAAYELARAVDAYLGTKILNGRGLFVSAALFGAAVDMALARKDATEQQISLMNRFGILDLTLEAQLLGADFFNQVQIRGQDATMSLMGGRMGSMMGADWYSSINFPTPSAFTFGDGAATVNTALATDNQVGGTAIKYDAGSGTFEAGDRIHVAGCRRPFIVATQTTGATGTIPLAHEIDEIIADGAAISVISNTGTNYTVHGAVFDQQAMGFAMPPLDQPPGADSAVVTSNGMSIRVVSDYDISSKKETLSLDLIVGGEAYDPRRIQLLADSE